MDASGNPQIIPDINVYQQKKNLAQGMMDLACNFGFIFSMYCNLMANFQCFKFVSRSTFLVLSANANQLRYVVETYSRHPYYWFSMISICISLILQVKTIIYFKQSKYLNLIEIFMRKFGAILLSIQPIVHRALFHTSYTMEFKCTY